MAQRKNYIITSDRGHNITKAAWNSSRRAVDGEVRALAKSEGTTYTREKMHDIVKRGFDTESGKELEAAKLEVQALRGFVSDAYRQGFDEGRKEEQNAVAVLVSDNEINKAFREGFEEGKQYILGCIRRAEA